jgi:hypothetical protein
MFPAYRRENQAGDPASRWIRQKIPGAVRRHRVRLGVILGRSQAGTIPGWWIRQGQKAKGARLRAPFQQNPISPRPGPSRNALTTPGKFKTTWHQLMQPNCHIRKTSLPSPNSHKLKRISYFKESELPWHDQFSTVFHIIWRPELLSLGDSGTDGGADSRREGFSPESDIFGVLGFDHDARFGFGA